jgi:serine/threonine-protein kinase PknG
VPGESRWRYETVLDENDTVIALLRYGDQIRWSGNYASALSFYNQAARVNPQSIDTHLRLAEVYIEQGAFTLAQDEVAQVQCRAISNWKLNWYRGRLLERQQKFAEAAAEYRELMADLPGELPPQQALARVYACMKDDRAAAGLYMKVLKADPDNAEAVIGAAHALFRLQRWNDAARILKEVSGGAAAYLDAQLLLVELYLCHMQPLMPVHIQKAAEVVESLYQHTEEPRYYLARGDVYRAAWQMARKRRLPADSALAGVSDTKPRTLGAIAEESYRLYLELEQCPTNREEIVRRKFAVTPWHFLRLWNIQRKS